MTDGEADAANEEILGRANATGSLFLSHTRVNGRIALRIAIGHVDTRDEHVRRAWTLLQTCAAAVHAARNSRGAFR
jgi:aromatic-L-amino-acid decarboxylase